MRRRSIAIDLYVESGAAGSLASTKWDPRRNRTCGLGIVASILDPAAALMFWARSVALAADDAPRLCGPKRMVVVVNPTPSSGVHPGEQIRGFH